MEIRNWMIINNPWGEGKVVWGNVYGNPKFHDGFLVRTSTLKSVRVLPNGDTYVETQNNIYKLPKEYAAEHQVPQ